MTDLRKAAEMALDALELERVDNNGNKIDLVAPAIEALRQALAQPEQRAAWQGNGGAGYNVGGTGVAKPEQEPVRWFQQFGDAPTKREWVGLHLNDMPETYAGDKSFLEGAKWAEVKLKEKNT